MDVLALSTIIILTLIVVLVVIYFVIRCLTQGKICQSRARLEGKTVVITGADTAIGIELVREMCKRGAERVIMAVENVEIGQVITVWTFHDFSITQILREINFGDFTRAKSAILTHLYVLDFASYEILHFLKAEIYQLNNTKPSKKAKTTVLELLDSPKLISRKI